MPTELATAYVQLIPSMQGMGKRIQAAMSGVDLTGAGRSAGASYSSGVASAAKAAQGGLNGAATAIEGTFGRVAKAGIGAVTGIGTAIVGLGLKGGLTRALNIEKAKTMFKGLKLDWADYESTIKASVDGTAYTMDAAALVAANLAASGVSAGKDMAEALNGAVGVSATFGAELSDIGGIYSKVAAQGKINGEIIQQFADRGINVTSILSQHLKKSGDEVKKMVTDGKVDFKTFSDAMYASFGDSAQGANDTFVGSMANMRSALNKIGEKFMTPFEQNAVPVFNAVREAVNQVSARLDPLVQKFSQFAADMSGKVSESIGSFTSAMEGGATPIQALAAAIDRFGGDGAASKIAAVATAVGSIAAVAPLLRASSGAIGAVSRVMAGVSSAASRIGASLSSAASSAVGFAGRLGGATLSAIGSFGKSLAMSFASPKLAANLDKVSLLVGTKLARAKTAARTAMEGVRSAIASKTPTFVRVLGESASSASAAFKAKFKIADKASREGSLLSAAFSKIRGAAGRLGGGLVTAAAGLAPVAGGLLAAGAAAVASGVDIEAAANNLLANIQALTTNLPMMATQLASLLPGIVAQMSTALPALGQAFISAVNTLMPALTAIMPQLGAALTATISALAPQLIAMLPTLMQAAIQLFTGIVQALAEIVPVLAEQLPSLVQSVATCLIENMPMLLSAGLELFMALVTSFLEVLPTLIEMLPDLVMQAGAVLVENGPALMEKGKELFGKIAEAVPKVLDALLNAIGSLLSNLPGAIAEYAPKLADAAGDMIMGLVNGIGDAAGWVKSKIEELCGNALGALKNFFGIHSPSRVMRKMFGYVGQGMVLGLDDKAADVAASMRGICKGVMDEASSANPEIAVAARRLSKSTSDVSGMAARQAGKSQTTIYQINGINVDGDSAAARTIDRLAVQTRIRRRA